MHQFHVPDMHCGGCLRAVRQAVQTLDPEAQVEADLKNRVVTIVSSQGEASVLSALDRAGFPARPILRQDA
jgi:copper chaperone